MFSAFYIGASGMKTHAEGIGVIGNNIANVNTVGFKNSKFTFQNLMSESLSAGGVDTGFSQIGMGVKMEDIKVDFSQGAFEVTNQITNLGIGGKGFFKVTNGADTHYTRAGNFQFDKNGYMVDPSGARLNGTALANGVRGKSQEIRLQPDATGNMTSKPKATSLTTVLTNLSGGQNTVNKSNPFFGLTSAWNGMSSNAPLTSAQYSHSTAVKVYDQNGQAHTLTIYYDEVKMSNAGGKKMWEYVVAMPPGEDTRAGFMNTSNAGLLMNGTLTFNSAGVLEGQSAFVPSGSNNPKQLSNWVPASFSPDGYPLISASFEGGGSISTGLNMGLANTGSGWANSVSNASAIGTDPSKLPSFTSKRAANASTAFHGTNSTIQATQNGYPDGIMNNLSVNNNGVIIGRYSNGQSIELYQVDLNYFTNDYGLRSEGGNHYAATSASGTALQGAPNTKGLGSITQGALETSNVDLALEFVGLINTQRGFQVNGKVITTSDSMIQEALSIKR